MSIALGIDLGKKTSWYAAVEDGDILVKDGRVPSTPRALTDLVELYHPEVVLLEASSITAWAVDALVAHDAPVWPVHPGSLPSRRSRRTKTDKIDARLLVRLWRAGVVTKAWIPPPELRTLRNLARTRTRLAQDRTRYRNRVHSHLNQEGQRISLGEVTLQGGRLFSRRGKTAALTAHPELLAAYRVQDLLTEEVRAFDARIEEVAKDLPTVLRLRSIPGFGPITSLAIYAEVGHIERFPTAETLVAYFGLDPTVQQSGDSLKQLGISHKGPGWIRGLLTQAAWAHVRYAPDSAVSHKYQRLAKRIGKSRAIVATARRLVKVAYWMWREQTDFESSGRTPDCPCRPP